MSGDIFSFLNPPEPVLVNVWLTDANLDLHVLCVKGVQATLASLEAAAGNGPNAVTAIQAHEHFNRFKEGERPLLLGYANTAEDAKEAAAAGVNASQKNLSIGYGLTDQEVEDSRREHTEAAETTAAMPRPPLTLDDLNLAGDLPAEDWTPSAEASRCALNLITMNKGNATLSLFWAGVLANNSGDPMWDDVTALIRTSFPTDDGMIE